MQGMVGVFIFVKNAKVPVGFSFVENVAVRC